MDLHRLSNLDLNLLLILDVLLEEKHVTRAAKRLHRSQSAVSHALSRLRSQLDDPLLVRNGRHMQPSTRAQRLQPLLRQVFVDLEQALSDKSDWDPAKCTRHFSIVGPDFTAIALPYILKTLEEKAPHATCELVPVSDDMFQRMSMGLHDLVFFRNIEAASDITNDPLCTLRHAVFVREGHPALAEWSKEAWLAYPHIRIRMVGGPSPVSMRLADDKLQRPPGPVVSSFLMTPPVIVHTNAMLTAPFGVMRSIIQDHKIVAMPCPIRVPDINLSLFSCATDRDPARKWFQEISHQILQETFDVHHTL